MHPIPSQLYFLYNISICTSPFSLSFTPLSVPSHQLEVSNSLERNIITLAIESATLQGIKKLKSVYLRESLESRSKIYHQGFSPPAPATLTPSLPATMTAVVKPANIPWSTTPERRVGGKAGEKSSSEGRREEKRRGELRKREVMTVMGH